MTDVVLSLRSTGNLLTNSNIPFDETALYNGSLAFNTTMYYKPSTTIATVSGDFTLETWVYPLSYADMMVASSDIDNNLQIFRLNQSGNLGSVSVYNNGTQIFNNVGTAVTPGAWSYLTWVRSGTTNTLYINGVSSATATNSTAFNFNIIGTFSLNQSIGYSSWYQGYVKDFRLTTAVVYTGNFTPPTAVLAKLANTTFLLNVTNYYNRFYDSAIGATNIKSPLLGSPLPGFSPASPYAQSTPTPQSRITQNEVVYNLMDEVTLQGGSLSFNGSTGYRALSIASLPTITGTGTFTIEAWVYPLDYTDQVLISRPPTAGDNTQIFRLNEGGNTTSPYGISIYDNGTQLFLNIGSGTYPVKNQWTHLAWVKNGTTNKLYINGVSSATYTGNVPDITPNQIGYLQNYSYPFNGYLTNIRIVNGVAVYTSNFTPPTQPLAATQSANTNGNPSSAITGAQTMLLLDATTAATFITDSSTNGYTVTNSGAGATPSLVAYSSSTPFPQQRLTNIGTQQIPGIFDEVSGIPATSYVYLGTTLQANTSYTHTIPAGYSVMIIEAWGGGGGAATVGEDTGGNSPSYTAQGGTDPGAGGYTRTIITNAGSLATKTLSVVVGGGGTGRGVFYSYGPQQSGLAGVTSTVSSGTATITTMTAGGGGGGGLTSAIYGSSGGTATGGADANIVGTNTTGIAYYYYAPNTFQVSPTGIMYTPNLGVVGYYGARYGSAGRVLNNLTGGGNYGTITTGGDNGQTGAVVISYY